MTERLALYDIDGLKANIMGISIEDGRGSEVFLKITPPVQYEYTESADGLVIANRKRSRMYPVDLILLSSSKHCQQLSALHAADYIAVGGAGVGAFFVEDTTGSTKLTGDSCRILQAPEWSFGNVIKEVTWKLMVTSSPAKMLFGGNEIL